MLATLVIGLREGLEAALIVGIIAAFLRRNGRSLVPMWLGVGAAVMLSLIIGVTLSLIEVALPQAAQEGLETIIGAVAVVFVTLMIVWMNTHARGMRAELESEAQHALGRGGATALAVMAFLAVLKEGFETSVFLLATFSAAQSAGLAALGAVVGIALAALLGWGIFAGGVRIDLGRFFRLTSVFLVLVAAGLVVTCLRTAHEAGWLNAGQQRTIDLSAIVQPGSIQAALLTGVLGIPADPRLIEVVAWVAYLVPALCYLFWPRRARPSAAGAQRLRWVLATGCLVLAAAVALTAWLIPSPQVSSLALVDQASQAPAGSVVIADSGAARSAAFTYASGATADLPLDASTAASDTHLGVTTQHWQQTATTSPDGAPSTITLDALITLAGGRVPVGISAAQNPGPFTAQWNRTEVDEVWLTGAGLLDASAHSTLTVTLTGGGLQNARTVSVTDTAAIDAVTAPDAQSVASAAATAVEQGEGERVLWGAEVPGALVIAAAVLVISALRHRARAPRGSHPAPTSPPPEPPTPAISIAAADHGRTS